MEPGMSIVNQINAGLNDVRSRLVVLATEVFVDDAQGLKDRAQFEFDEIIEMIEDHRCGRSIPWLDRKLRVEEEFS